MFGINRGGAWLPPCAAAVLTIFLAGCDDPRFPRDPDGTLDDVLASGTMTVGAVSHSPWVVTGGTAPSGAEVALIESFAQELGVTVEWRELSAFTALEALEQGEVDLAIGGFTQRDLEPHAGVAPTYAYFTSRLVVAAPPDTALPDDLEGRSVLVPPDVPAARLVRDKGGKVVEQTKPQPGALVALPNWQLGQTDLVATDIELRESRHVMAVPQGENAWLMKLERFLRRASGGMAERLRDYRP